MGVDLGSGLAHGRWREKKSQGQDQPRNASHVAVIRTSHLPCTLPLLESQVAALSSLRRSGLKIGAVAERSGVPVKTIRFYSEEGLIHPIGRSEGGYRLYGEEVLAELALIRTLKAMEIPLQDVRQILESRRSGVCTCASLQQRIHHKVGEIERKITALHDLHTELTGLLGRWQDCGGRKSSAA